ncbi:hypothetical protein GE118_03640 [Mycoplasma sp. NEAQ87857]|uniref:hypothetical protein n=1 Tax=Mycoplasma sp. NEAQ87857 TaxID=2683967 RepID=UPI0013186C0E|nr:hypothetical protein [Mycoplasma sp. NEAQ87857]QGZ97875.1 hypothetical protein GE118_03640 [Mycoplasma sp. NEAQ87857]
MTLEQLNNLKLSLINFKIANKNLFNFNLTNEFLQENELYKSANEYTRKLNFNIGQMIYKDFYLFDKLLNSILTKWDVKETIKVYQDDNGNDLIVDGNVRALILMLLYKTKDLVDWADYSYYNYNFRVEDKDLGVLFDIKDKINKFNLTNDLLNQVEIEYLKKDEIHSTILNNLFPLKEQLKTNYNKGIYLFNIFSTFIENDIKTLEQYKANQAFIFNPFNKDAKDFFKDYKEACFLYQVFQSTLTCPDDKFCYIEPLSFDWVFFKDFYNDYEVFKKLFYNFCYENKVSKYAMNNIMWYLKYGYRENFFPNTYKFDQVIKFEFDTESRKWINICQKDDYKKTESIFNFIHELDRDELLKTTRTIEPTTLTEYFYRHVNLKRKQFEIKDIIQEIFKLDAKNLSKLEDLVDLNQTKIHDLIYLKQRINDGVSRINKFSSHLKSDSFINYLLKQNEELLTNNNFQFNVFYSNLRAIIQYIVNIIYLDYLTFLTKEIENDINLVNIKRNKKFEIADPTLLFEYTHLASKIRICNFNLQLTGLKLGEPYNLSGFYNDKIISNITRSFFGSYDKNFTPATQMTITTKFYEEVVENNNDFVQYVKDKFNLDFNTLIPSLINDTKQVLNKWVHCSFLITNYDSYADLVAFLKLNIFTYKNILNMLKTINVKNFSNTSKELFKSAGKIYLIKSSTT